MQGGLERLNPVVLEGQFTDEYSAETLCQATRVHSVCGQLKVRQLLQSPDGQKRTALLVASGLTAWPTQLLEVPSPAAQASQLSTQ